MKVNKLILTLALSVSFLMTEKSFANEDVEGYKTEVGEFEITEAGDYDSNKDEIKHQLTSVTDEIFEKEYILSIIKGSNYDEIKIDWRGQGIKTFTKLGLEKDLEDLYKRQAYLKSKLGLSQSDSNQALDSFKKYINDNNNLKNQNFNHGSITINQQTNDNGEYNYKPKQLQIGGPRVDYDTLKNVFEEEKVKYEALSDQEKWDKGALGFYLENNEYEAVYALTRVDNQRGNFLNASERNKTENSLNMDNMKRSIDNIVLVQAKRQNDKGIDGKELNDIGITSYLMAAAQANANYSARVIGHAGVFPTSENLAWNFEKNGQRAIQQWWDNEKVLYDYLRSIGYTDLKQMSSFLSKPENVKAMKSKFGDRVNSSPRTVGHYINMVDYNRPDKAAGYAVRRGENEWNVHSLVMSSNPIGKIYTIDGYKNLFSDYYKRMQKILETEDKKKFREIVKALRQAFEDNKNMVRYAEEYMQNNYMRPDKKSKLARLIENQKALLVQFEEIIISYEQRV